MNTLVEPTPREILLGRLWSVARVIALIVVSALAGIGAVAVWLATDSYTPQLGSLLLTAGLTGIAVGLALFGPDVSTVRIHRKATVPAQ